MSPTIVRRTAALLALFLLASGCHEGTTGHPASRTAGPASAAHHTSAIPWADLPPTHPHIPSYRVPRRPDPSLARAARPCRGGDLALREFGIGAAMGTTVKNLRFSLAPGHSPCAVSGRPGVTAHTVEGTALPGRPSSWTSRYHQPVLLTATAHALVQLVWPSVCFAPTGHGSAILTYARRTWTVSMGPLSRTCHFEPDRPLDSVGITAFTPPVPVPARRVTAYDPVRVRWPGEITAHIDRPTTFEITLTSPTDLALAPCPDYRIGAAPGDGGTFGLNCAAVPYRDDRGRPFLPAGQPITFEMRLDPVEALRKYSWSIVAPGSPPDAAGVITLR